MTGKYSDPIAEVADAILGDGFADDQAGTTEYGGEAYALVTLYRPTFTEDAEADLGARLDAYLADRAPDLFTGSRVIIRTDAQGFVDTYYGPAHPAGDPAAFRALMAAWTDIVVDDAATAEALEAAR